MFSHLKFFCVLADSAFLQVHTFSSHILKVFEMIQGDIWLYLVELKLYTSELLSSKLSSNWVKSISSTIVSTSVVDWECDLLVLYGGFRFPSHDVFPFLFF